jgi:hypothetical protein
VAFSDQTDAAGLTFTHQPPPDHPSGPMPAGGSVGDFNNDDLPDLFVLGSGDGPDALFINNGDGTFTDQAAAWGLTDLYKGVGTTVGDYDTDGDDDIFVSSMGNCPPTGGCQGVPHESGVHRLYRNDGGTFTEVAAAAGVATTEVYNDGYGAAFGDIDQDGDLDLFVGGWHKDGGAVGDSLGSRLFRNDGDGTFTNITDSAGVFQTNTHAFGAVFVDMDGDRYPEMLVAGDFGTSRYYKNNKDGTFTELDPGTGLPAAVGDPNWSIGKAHNGMGTTVGDFNRDGNMDWFITAIWPTWHLESPYWGNGLYLNEGGNVLSNITTTAGVEDGGWGWGTCSVDADHDGWMDLVMTNGFPNDDLVTGETFTGEQSYVFRNVGSGGFEEVALASGLSHTLQGRGLVHFDYDVDGDMDIAIFSNGDNLKLFRNDVVNDVSGTPADANWLKLRLDTSAHPGLAPEGIGASVRIKTGSEFQYMRLTGGSNFLGRSELVAHFGLGTATTVDQIQVTWADGFRSQLSGVAANQQLEIAAVEPHTATDMVRGEIADLQVTGLRAGEKAHFFYGFTGLGDGPCFAALGGICLDVVNGIYIGSAEANGVGTAVRSVTIPQNPGLQTVYTQVLVRRGEGGVNSLKSNSLVTPVQRP